MKKLRPTGKRKGAWFLIVQSREVVFVVAHSYHSLLKLDVSWVNTGETLGDSLKRVQLRHPFPHRTSQTLIIINSNLIELSDLGYKRGIILISIQLPVFSGLLNSHIHQTTSISRLAQSLSSRIKNPHFDLQSTKDLITGRLVQFFNLVRNTQWSISPNHFSFKKLIQLMHCVSVLLVYCPVSSSSSCLSEFLT
jgi:hypothetical protein